jgi:hypothetical protein
VSDLHDQAREWNRTKRRATRESLIFHLAVGLVIAVSIIGAGWDAAWWAAGGVILRDVGGDAWRERRLLRWLDDRERERRQHQRTGAAS